VCGTVLAEADNFMTATIEGWRSRWLMSSFRMLSNDGGWILDEMKTLFHSLPSVHPCGMAFLFKPHMWCMWVWWSATCSTGLNK
jgi:hypothetical protein